MAYGLSSYKRGLKHARQILGDKDRLSTTRSKSRKKLTAIIVLGYGNAQCAPRHILAPRPKQFYTIPILLRYPVKSVFRLRSIHSLEK